MGHNLDKVLVTLQVFGQQNQVPALVILVELVEAGVVGDIDLAAEDGLEQLLAFFAAFGVNLCYIVVKFLDAEHVAMVGNGHAAHPVGDGFVDECLDRSLAVKDGVL